MLIRFCIYIVVLYLLCDIYIISKHNNEKVRTLPKSKEQKKNTLEWNSEIILVFIFIFLKAGKMAQWLEVLAAKCDDLGLMPRTHMGGENWLPQFSSDLQVHLLWLVNPLS